MVVGTPSVDGLADYFQRLSHYEHPLQSQAISNYSLSGADGPGQDGTAEVISTHDDDQDDDDGEDTEVESDSDSASERARTVSRAGTVNVANPRTPGGRLVPSRSFEIERPPANFTLTMAGVVRRSGATNAA
jgi:hypothetical protein